jgi:hypothetical protein
MSDTSTVFPFEHKNNIRVGIGRVLWGPSTTDISGNFHQPGWVLPGGLRTDNSARAYAVAVEINAICGAARG